ncbi:hypothetical protein PFICI_02434 [Pestalotiopsis fici W106-1]|uniref:Tyrosinase copper-binding domain-containing protein n=1 Tax=Pestalotiopsis fici (strain W106-1 / CGMCC3.15140) TaxID=1229662 RepID=W3XEG4_PESFW|nr:uncharacterized protein PFICI_02434 [Pestalotiopsis fici W106-1]ETS84409.1 hypothetical protein PFICI_02434 [Pestalotiopsis fici W106-1]
MWFLFETVAALLLSAVPLGSAACTEKRQIVPWSTLTHEEKQAYVNADVCLTKLPSTSGFRGAVTRWDDLMWPHIYLTSVVHNCGAFLPWHRYFVLVHDRMIREECGYDGPFPYWYETEDIDDIAGSDLWNYYGHNGVGDDHCLGDGPFANITLRFTYNNTIGEYCLKRNWNQKVFNLTNQAQIDACMQYQNYTPAWRCWGFNPHGAGHQAVGGHMADPTYSPGDPKVDLPNRLEEMGGANIAFTIINDPDNVEYPSPEILSTLGDNGNWTTLEHNLWMMEIGDFAPNITIADIMDVGGDVMCADYVDL